jgi:hypothetical protein
MNARRCVATTLVAILLSGGALGFAADRGQSPKPAEGHMMMENGMMDMMNMMGMCRRMMDTRTTGHMLPQLPAGNEKLQLQMQSEVLQKIGEITAKYAAQIK